MADIFDIGFETDLSELTGTVVSDGTITRTTPGLISTTGKCSIAISSGSTAARYIRKAFTAFTTETDLYMRWYWDVGTWLQTNGQTENVLNLIDNGDVRRAHLRMNWGTTPKFQIRCTLRNDAGTESNSSYYDLGATFPAYMQVHVHKATNGTGANDAFIKLYAETTEVASVTGIDLYDNFTFKEAQLGHVELVDADTSGTFSVDQWKMTTTGGLIGAHDPDVAPTVTIPTGYLATNNISTRTISQMRTPTPSNISVTEGTNPITLVTLTCTSGKGTMTMTASGSSLVSGNGTNAISIIGGSETDINNTLATFAFTGLEPTRENVTVTILATDGTLNDSENLVLFNHRTSLTVVADSYADLVAMIQTAKMILPEGSTTGDVEIVAEDDDTLTDTQTITLFVPTGGGGGGFLLQFRRRRRQ